jgi:hypothetical protein
VVAPLTAVGDDRLAEGHATIAGRNVTIHPQGDGRRERGLES